MERYMIVGFAVLLAILLDGSRSGRTIDPNYNGHLTVATVHPKYNDSQNTPGYEQAPTKGAVREPFAER